MVLLREKILVQMPGNVVYIDTYLEGVWSVVTTLTSAIERYDAPPQWLKGKFQDYNGELEKTIKRRLDKIQYDIDTSVAVHLVLGGDSIEKVTITLILRLR
jgi:hypothetical protein